MIEKLAIDAIMDTVEWKAIEDVQASDDMPYATHSGVLPIEGLNIKCWQLSDGRRVFDADDIEELFGDLRTTY